MKRFPLLLLAALLLTACANNRIDEAILQSDGPGLWMNGTALITYDPLTFQLASNKGLRQFRVHNDTMSEYFILILDTFPTQEGQTVNGALKSSATEDLSALEFRVEKTDGQGNIWLWNKSRKIAVVVRSLD